MYVFLIVILVLAALLEYFSLRGGAACADVDIALSETRAEPGDRFFLRTTVSNTGRLPLSYLCVKTSYPSAVPLPEGVNAQSEGGGIQHEGRAHIVSDVFRLWGRRKKTREVQLAIEKRGLHKFVCKEIHRGDFLGLKTESEKIHLRREILVYPRRLEHSALLEALGRDSGESTARRWLLRDPVLTMGVREYTGSEPMRTISWSQTARRGDLMVREFDYTRSLHCCLCFCANGLRVDEEGLLDSCCSAVRTICEELTERGVGTMLFTNASLQGFGVEAVRSCVAAKNRMQDALEILARATATPGCGAEALAEACLRRSDEAVAYVLVIPHRSEETARAAELLLQRTGIEPLVVAVDELEGE